jgi:hypothetical protein
MAIQSQTVVPMFRRVVVALTEHSSAYRFIYLFFSHIQFCAGVQAHIMILNTKLN